MSRVAKFAPHGRLRAAAYRCLWTLADVDPTSRLSNACVHLSAGLLRQSDMFRARTIQWNAFGAAVDDAASGLEEWEQRIYGDVVRPSSSVLLVGCGTGRDLAPLVSWGARVTGLDQSAELVECARQNLASRGQTARLLAAPIETADLEGPYDVIIFSGGCYSAIIGSAARVSMLSRLGRHLVAEGRLVITFTARAQASPWPARLARLASWLSRTDWRPEPGDRFTRDTLVPRLVRSLHPCDSAEVGRECAKSGLRIIRDEPVGVPLHCVVAVHAAALAQT